MHQAKRIECMLCLFQQCVLWYTRLLMPHSSFTVIFIKTLYFSLAIRRTLYILPKYTYMGITFCATKCIVSRREYKVTQSQHTKSGKKKCDEGQKPKEEWKERVHDESNWFGLHHKQKICKLDSFPPPPLPHTNTICMELCILRLLLLSVKMDGVV